MLKIKHLRGTFPGWLPDMENIYLQRYAWPKQAIQTPPKDNTKIIVVIPCYHEPEVLQSMESLYNCDLPECQVEVLVVVNNSEDETDEIKTFNKNTLKSMEKWLKTHEKPGIDFYPISAFDLPRKQAGVGLARKIGMDEAVRRFEYLNYKKGIIVCFDADCTCSTNYFHGIYRHYQQYPDTNVGLVYYEHPLEGDMPKEVYSGITNYELHLRYYKNALKYAKFPYSFHTVGSCITVTSEAYQKQNGMNKRKAGEDFYFLQKVFALGNVGEIHDAKVVPSPRPSHRVPFGTGKAIQDFMNKEGNEFTTYHPRSFIDLKAFLEIIPKLYNNNDITPLLFSLPESIQKHLKSMDFELNLAKIKNNSTSKEQFLKSFFVWFNGFTVLKYLHYVREKHYKSMNILEAANWLGNKMGRSTPFRDNKEALMYFRKIDRSN